VRALKTLIEYQNIFKLSFPEMLKFFILLSVLNAFGFLATFVQLSIVKPTSRKVLIPVTLVTIAAFCLLIAVDFYLEVQLAHSPPKETYTKGSTDKKGKARIKIGYLVIYGEMDSSCLEISVFRDSNELSNDFENGQRSVKTKLMFFLEKKKEGETQEIVISHIT
jgi:hypothetical protein